MKIYVNDVLISDSKVNPYKVIMDYVRTNFPKVFDNLTTDINNMTALIRAIDDGLDGYCVSCMGYDNPDYDINENCIIIDFDTDD